ncbi:MAG: hypothetical protein JSU00_02320 [Acidobacteria bacterium]|nr:hypothetical protein [Acidobacteriota bacterium]
MKRRILLSLILAAGATAVHARPKAEPVEAVDTEQTIFASGGIVELKDSIGNVQVEGWERSEVLVTVTKSAVERTEGELDRIVVAAERRGPDHLVITTRQPLRHRADVRLSYVIHVPRQTKLVIAHDRGDIEVRNVSANMHVSNRMGRIDLSLPQNERYAIDAKTHFGRVASEWDDRHYSPDELAPVRLLLRVGTGDITLRRARHG